MDIWKEIGITSNNSSEHQCYEKASLLVNSDSGILEKQFPFETIRNESYVETSSIMNMEYSKREKSIFTPFYWLPFCKGARVKFIDGEELTIKDLTVVNDSKSALGNGHGKKGVEIVF